MCPLPLYTRIALKIPLATLFPTGSGLRGPTPIRLPRFFSHACLAQARSALAAGTYVCNLSDLQTPMISRAAVCAPTLRCCGGIAERLSCSGLPIRNGPCFARASYFILRGNFPKLSQQELCHLHLQSAKITAGLTRSFRYVLPRVPCPSLTRQRRYVTSTPLIAISLHRMDFGRVWKFFPR